MAARNGSGKSASTQPMPVEQITKEAQTYDYNPLIPLKYWLRSAGTLVKEAEIYEQEGNDQQTYLLLFRHATLIINHLSKHPDGRKSENKASLIQAEKEALHSLEKLEVLKPRITKRYERWEQLMKDRNARRKAEALARGDGAGRVREESTHRRMLSDPAAMGSKESLAASDNPDLAVQLAHSEMRRRATARKATRQAGISEEVEQERRTAGLWSGWEAAYTDDQGTDQDTLSKQMQNVRLQVDGSSSGSMSKSRPSHESSKSDTYSYPSVPGHHRSREESPRCQPSSRNQSPPARPAKEPTGSPWRNAPLPPPKDELFLPIQGAVHAEAPPRPAKSDINVPNKPPKLSLAQPQDLKPSGFTFKPSAYLENGTPLRTIFLPPELRRTFLRVAEPNTRANLETCGILCGTLISNALFVSKLVIPEQESTSDTCETVNESALFDYVDGEDLMVLGWIHTHPTQTCFMSSRDLHTHGGYQVMMPESIAIVCAPSKNDWGVFRLTDPPGMKAILNCTQSGLFHPHDQDELYTEALRPGHVFEAKGLEFGVVDMRPKR